MVHIRRLRAACVLLVICPAAVHGQAAPREIFLVCGSQPNEPTVYFSGVMEGPATAFQGFRNGFVSFLTQRYGYKGAVGCAPANTAAIAQNALNARATALRNQKKNVVATGWTESAAVAAAPAASPLAPAAKQATPAAASASGASGGGSGSGSSQLSSVLAAVFGTGGGADAGGAKAGGAAHATGSPGTSGTSGTSGDQGGAAQMASTLATVLSSKSSGSSGAGAQNAPAPESAPEPTEGLGSAQAQNTKLVVYGCGRQGTQVACVTELTNQNQKDTLIQTGAVWKDTFIVDDRGDRHQRSDGFFLNIDGDQRSQLDVSYGKAARFILMFDGVPAKVQKVTLRSTAGGLDVEDISLLPPTADAQKH